MTDDRPSSEVSFRVELEDTAEALGSGDLPVLGTPRLLAWLEVATCAAAADLLAPGTTSVGTRILLDHRRPTPVGERVWVSAVLVDRDDRRLQFQVQAVDRREAVVGSGLVTRMVVDRSEFLARLPSPGEGSDPGA